MFVCILFMLFVCFISISLFNFLIVYVCCLFMFVFYLFIYVCFSKSKKIKVARVVERSLRESRAIDNEALCIISGEKVR